MSVAPSCKMPCRKCERVSYTVVWIEAIACPYCGHVNKVHVNPEFWANLHPYHPHYGARCR